MVNAFGDLVANYKPSKPRELPDWAMKIFSPHMIAFQLVIFKKKKN